MKWLGHGGLQLALLHETKGSKDLVIVVGRADSVLKLRKDEVT